jgi:CDP-diacylglycerol pyrophosphatase
MEVVRSIGIAKDLIKNEMVLLKPKQSKLKKNRMQAKNEAIQDYTCNLADIGLKKQHRKEIAKNRRANSK